MKTWRNMGGVDRLARLVGGLALLVAGLSGALTSGWQLAAVPVGAVLLITAAAGICPGYLPFGINTRRPGLGSS